MLSLSEFSRNNCTYCCDKRELCCRKTVFELLKGLAMQMNEGEASAEKPLSILKGSAAAAKSGLPFVGRQKVLKAIAEKASILFGIAAQKTCTGLFSGA